MGRQLYPAGHASDRRPGTILTNSLSGCSIRLTLDSIARPVNLNNPARSGRPGFHLKFRLVYFRLVWPAPATAAARVHRNPPAEATRTSKRFAASIQTCKRWETTSSAPVASARWQSQRRKQTRDKNSPGQAARRIFLGLILP